MEAAQRVDDSAVGATHQRENASHRQALRNTFGNCARRQEFSDCAVAWYTQVGVCGEQFAVERDARIDYAEQAWKHLDRA